MYLGKGGGIIKKRIWELDALRGLWILLMIAIHLSYDLIDLYQVWQPKHMWLYNWSLTWGGTLFLVISGISATLGSHPVKRGIQVFLCGMLCTLVTLCMYLFNFAGRGILIYFGALQCLGACMILWPVFKRLPPWLLAGLGLVLSLVGLYLLRNIYVSFPWLLPLGLRPSSFASSDYYPLLPNFGYFLIGAALGKSVYAKKESLLPNINAHTPIIRFLRFCGQKSLLIYLLHQPVLAGLIGLILFLL